MKPATKIVFQGWTVLNKKGRIERYAIGYGVKEYIVETKKAAYEMARLLAEREDELTCGDINRWEFDKMPVAQVRRMGYRVVQASVVVRA